MKTIYPKNIKKYPGTIYKNIHKTWTYVYGSKGKGNYHSKTFKTEIECQDYKREYAINNDLKIKNKCIDHGEYYSMETTQGISTLIDKDDWERIDKLFWNAYYSKYTKSYYFINSGDGKQIRLHNFIMKHTPTEITIDHISRDTHDNRKFNLRKADKSTQCKNQRIRRDNTSGVKGVAFNKQRNQWVAYWRENKKTKSKSFSLKKYGDEAKSLAVACRYKHSSRYL